jgi:hypothetical protein
MTNHKLSNKWKIGLIALLLVFGDALWVFLGLSHIISFMSFYVSVYSYSMVIVLGSGYFVNIAEKKDRQSLRSKQGI